MISSQNRRNDRLESYPCTPYKEIRPSPFPTEDDVNNTTEPNIKSNGTTTTKFKALLPSFRTTQEGGIDFPKLVNLFRDRRLAKAFDRQANCFEKLAKVYEQGLYLDHINEITELLSLAREKIPEGGAIIIPAIVKFFQVCGAPIIEEGYSRDIHHARSEVTRFVNELVMYFELGNEDIIIAISNIVMNMITDPDNTSAPTRHTITEDLSTQNPLSLADPDTNGSRRPLFDGLEIITKTNFTVLTVKALELVRERISSTGSMNSLASCLSINIDNCDKKVQCALTLLKVLKKLTTNKEGSRQVVSCGTALVTLANCLPDKATEDDYLFMVSDVFWNVLESESGNEAAVQLAKELPVQKLKTLIDVYGAGARVHEKEIRNEFLILTLLLLNKNSSQEAIQVVYRAGFIDMLFEHVIKPDLRLAAQQASQTKVSKALPPIACIAEDFEFRRLLMQIGCKLCAKPEVLADVLNRGYFDFAKIYMSLEKDSLVTQRWNSRQVKELQLQVVFFLSQHLKALQKPFLAMGGTQMAISFLQYAVRSEHGANPSTNTQGDLVGLVPAALKLVLALSELNTDIKRTLGIQGAFHTVLNLLRDNRSTFEEHRLSLVLIASLCQGTKINKQVFGENEGVTILSPFLKTDYSTCNPKDQSSITIAIIEAIWSCICGCGGNEMTFSQQLGVFSLLDLLESFPDRNVRGHILGCCLDFLENPKLRLHFLEWRMKKCVSKSISHMLLDFWREEERVLGVVNGPHETVILNKRPLLGKKQIVQHPRDRNEEGWSISETHTNLRPKIFAMFSKLGFDYFMDPPTADNNIVSDALPLTIEDKVKLSTISKYLDFKIGEVWEEIAEELEFMGVRPVTPDQECVNAAKLAAQEKNEKLAGKQRELLKKKEEMEFADEKSFLDDLQHRETTKNVDIKEHNHRYFLINK